MNSRIRCLVVDDEPLAMEIMAEYIAKIPELELIACLTNPIEGLKLVQQGGVELVFLDVQMPEITGIQFAKIADDACSIILTTANPNYALEGFDVGVLDYLLKPISFERFSKAVNKIIFNRTRSGLISNRENVEDSSSLKPIHEADFIFVKTDYRMQKVYFDEIHYIEGLKDYVSIYTGQDRIITLMGMGKMEDVLPSKRFMRVHRSYIVALEKISSIEKNKISVMGKNIPIGETYRDLFLKHIHLRE